MSRKCINKSCAYNTPEPCEAAEGCAGFEEEQVMRCATCRWYAGFEGVCCNGDSNHRGEFREPDDMCSEWKGRELN